MKHSVLFLLLALMVGGCAGLVAGNLANGLSNAILNQEDPEIVRVGAPAYLLMLDGMIDGEPEDTDLLLAASKLYGAYASIFVSEPERSSRMANKSFDYSLRALCLENKRICSNYKQPYDQFVTLLEKTDKDDLPYLFALGSAWAGVIQSNSSDWNALADLPKVIALMQQVVRLDEGYQQGSAHTYLGVLSSLRPASLGGKPEQGRRHFEKAIELSNGQNLMNKVLFARYYARLVYDRELHDKLLTEVLKAEVKSPGLTLINTMAQDQAKTLQQSANDYF